MNPWLSLGLRWILLLVLFSFMSLLLYLFGIHAVPSLVPLDRAISEAMNPDAYVPVVDEFFRAVTDYSNLVVSVPLLSLGIATYAYRLSLFTRRRAVKWTVLSCAGWWLVLGLIYQFLDIPVAVMLALGALPLLVALGAGPRLLFETGDAKRWITGLLVAETVVLSGLWLTGNLFWNAGLPGANYFLFPSLMFAFGLAIYVFRHMDLDAKLRFQRVFLLVLLTVLLTDLGATDISKEVVGRPRPMSELNAPWNESLRTIPEELLRGRNSYPSGHTSGTFALLTPFFWAVCDRRVRGLLLGWGVLQAVSRVYTVAHFTSDVVLGAAIGFGTGTLVYFLLGRPRLMADSATAKGEDNHKRAG